MLAPLAGYGFSFFFFNDTATTEIYTLSLHDALPICPEVVAERYYTTEDCERLERPKYREAERLARRALRHWDAYNVWVQASFIDMAYNVPSALSPDTTVMQIGRAHV